MDEDVVDCVGFSVSTTRSRVIAASRVDDDVGVLPERVGGKVGGVDLDECSACDEVKIIPVGQTDLDGEG